MTTQVPRKPRYRVTRNCKICNKLIKGKPFCCSKKCSLQYLKFKRLIRLAKEEAKGYDSIIKCSQGCIHARKSVNSETGWECTLSAYRCRPWGEGRLFETKHDALLKAIDVRRGL